MRYRHRRVRKIAAPGPYTSQGPCDRSDAALVSMLPQDGVGGWMPSPRNDSADSVRISVPTSIAERTITSGKTLGSTCCTINRIWLAPSTRAAVTNSRSLSDSVCPRTNSDTVGHDSSPRMITSVNAEGLTSTATFTLVIILGLLSWPTVSL